MTPVMIGFSAGVDDAQEYRSVVGLGRLQIFERPLGIVAMQLDERPVQGHEHVVHDRVGWEALLHLCVQRLCFGGVSQQGSGGGGIEHGGLVANLAERVR